MDRIKLFLILSAVLLSISLPAIAQRPCADCTPADADLHNFPSAHCGGSVRGDCGNGGKWVARFNGYAGATYHFDTCPDNPCSGNSNFDLDLAILNDWCQMVDWVDGLDTCNWNPNDWIWNCQVTGTYYVAIAPWPLLDDSGNVRCGGDGTHSFTLKYYAENLPTAGEYCPNAISLSGALPIVVSGNTCSFQNDYDGFCGDLSPSPDVVYAYTPPFSGQITLDPCDTPFHVKLWVWDGCISRNVLGCLPYAGGSGNECDNPDHQRLSCLPVEAGQTYYIVVDGGEGECGDFTLVLSRCYPDRPCADCMPPDVDLGDFPASSCGGSVSGNCIWDGKWVGQFSGERNGIYHFDLCALEPCAGDGNADFDIAILDSACVVLDGVDGWENCGWRPNDWQWTCPYSGTFYAVIGTWPMLHDTGTGLYLECHAIAADSFQLRYYLDPPPTTPGDRCADAGRIHSLPDTIRGNICEFTNDFDVNCRMWYPFPTGGRDAVCSYSPATDECISISLCQSNFMTILYVFADSCAGDPIACSREWYPCPGGTQTERSYLSSVELSAGHTYYIVVDSWDEWQCEDFTLIVSPCAPLPGDVIETAFTIPGLPFSTSGTTVGFFDDYHEICWDVRTEAPDVVYAYQPVSDVTVEVDLTAANFVVRLYVYEDSQQNPILCEHAYYADLQLYAGRTYYFVIDGEDRQRGSYGLQVEERRSGRCCHPRNPECADQWTARQCSYWWRGVWTEGELCASPCPPLPPAPPAAIDSFDAPVIGACNYLTSMTTNCAGEIFYSVACSESIYVTNAAGQLLRAVPCVIDGIARWYDGLAYDENRQMLWLTTGEDVCLVNPHTGIGSVRFPRPENAYRITFDPSDGTLWFYNWDFPYLAHLDTFGTPLGIWTPLDMNGLPYRQIRGVSVNRDQTLFVSHGDARLTLHDRNTGAYLGLYGLNERWQPRTIAADAISRAPQVILWWHSDTKFYAYAVESTASFCHCPEADSVVIKLNAARDHTVVRFRAPEAGTYKIYGSSLPNAVYPSGFSQVATLTVPVGAYEWTDPDMLRSFKKYLVIHDCAPTVTTP